MSNNSRLPTAKQPAHHTQEALVGLLAGIQIASRPTASAHVHPRLLSRVPVTDGTPPAPGLRLGSADIITPLSLEGVDTRVVVWLGAHWVRTREPQVHMHSAPTKRGEVDYIA